jgi:hypothetical protein
MAVTLSDEKPLSNPIFSALKARSGTLLSPKLRLTFEQMCDHMFDLSGSAQVSSEKRTSCFEGFSVLKQQSKRSIQSIVAAVDQRFDEPLKKDIGGARISELNDDLNLVDIGEFEDQLAIDRMVKLGEERYWLPLEAITLRLAALLDLPAKKIELPFGLRALCEGYREAIRPLELDEFVVEELDRAFLRNLLPELGPVYQELSDSLAEAGLLPDIEKTLEASGSQLAAVATQKMQRPKPRVHVPQNEATPPVLDDQLGVQVDTTGSTDSSAVQTMAPGATQSRSNMQSGPVQDGPAGVYSAPLQSQAGVGGTAANHGAGQQTAMESPSASSFRPTGVPGALSHSGLEQGLATNPSLPTEPIISSHLFGGPSVTHSGDSFLMRQPPGVESPSGPTTPPNTPQFLPNQLGASVATVDEHILNRVISGAGYTGASDTMVSMKLPKSQEETVVQRIVSERQAGSRVAAQGASLVDRLGLGQLGQDGVGIRARVQMVDDLFDTLHTAVPMSTAMSSSMDAIKLPLAQLSISEPNFYRDREHPARLLIERISELTSLTPANNPRIEGRVKATLEKLSDQYDGGNDAFDKALVEITDLALMMLKQQQRNIQRQVASEDGREKRDLASDWVDQALLEGLPQKSLPLPIIQFVDGFLRDELILSHIREADANTLMNTINHLGKVNEALLDIADTGTVLSRPSAQNLTAKLKDSIAESESMPTESLAQLDIITLTLSGERPVELIRSTLLHERSLSEPRLSGRLAELPRLRRWVRQARQLPLNSWLVNTLPSGARQHLQLIWRNDDKTRFVFTNERGQRQLDVTVIQLARMLSHSLSPLNPSDQLSIIEQSVFATLAKTQDSLADAGTPLDIGGADRSELTDEVQSMLRRARRRGPTMSALAIHAEGIDAALQIRQFIHDSGVATAIEGMLSQSTHGMILQTIAIERVQQAIETGFSGSEALSGIGITVIDGNFSSAEILWQSVEDTAKRGLALSPNKGVIAQVADRVTDISGAVRTTYKRLRDEMPPKLSLRRMMRVDSQSHNQVEEAYLALIDGSADTSGEMTQPTGYHSPALSIALDYVKVNAICQLADHFSRAGVEVPLFNLRVSTDAALHHDFLEFVLSEISESAIGTNRLCLEFRDSKRLREEPRIADFTRTLRSIGCLISIWGVNPSRGNTSELQSLNPHMLALDRGLWPADDDERLPALHRAISDLHHLVGEHVVIRDVVDFQTAARLGIDFVEQFEPEDLSPQALQDRLPAVKR